MDSHQHPAGLNGSPIRPLDYTDKIKHLEKMHSNLILLLESTQKEMKEVFVKYENVKGNVERIGTMLNEMKSASGELEAPRKHKLSLRLNNSPAKKQKQADDDSAAGTSARDKESKSESDNSDRENQEDGQNGRRSKTAEEEKEQKPFMYQLTSGAELEKIKKERKSENAIVGKVWEYDNVKIEDFENKKTPFSFLLSNEKGALIHCQIWDKEPIGKALKKIKMNRIISVKNGCITPENKYTRGNAGFILTINSYSSIDVFELGKRRSKVD